MQKNLCITLGKELTRALQENPILRDMNKSALVRSALTEYIEKNLKEEKENENDRGKE